MLVRGLMSRQGDAESIFDQPVISGQDIAGTQEPQERGLPRALQGEGRRAVPHARGQGQAEHRDQPEDRPRLSPTPRASPGRSATRSGSATRRSRSSASTRPARCSWTSSSSWTSRRPAASLNVRQGHGLEHLRRGRRPGAERRPSAPRSRRPIPGVDARSMNEVQANFGALMGQVDKFLMMTVSLALLVGIVGIINTMLMSTTERFVEFGVLRTNGWSRGQHPDPGDARERLPRPALGDRRLPAGRDRYRGRQPVHQRGRPAGGDPRRSWRWASACRSSWAPWAGSTPPGGPPGWCPMDAIRLGSH